MMEEYFGVCEFAANSHFKSSVVKNYATDFTFWYFKKPFHLSCETVVRLITDIEISHR